MAISTKSLKLTFKEIMVIKVLLLKRFASIGTIEAGKECKSSEITKHIKRTEYISGVCPQEIFMV